MTESSNFPWRRKESMRPCFPLRVFIVTMTESITRLHPSPKTYRQLTGTEEESFVLFSDGACYELFMILFL